MCFLGNRINSTETAGQVKTDVHRINSIKKNDKKDSVTTEMKTV